MVQGPGIPTRNYFCVFMCAKRPGEIHPNGNSDDHWGGPGTGGWGGKERWSGETPDCNCCVNMSIFYKLAGEMLSAGDDRQQPWLDLVGVVTGSHVRGPGLHGLYGSVFLSMGPRFVLKFHLSPS